MYIALACMYPIHTCTFFQVLPILIFFFIFLLILGLETIVPIFLARLFAFGII